ncbi:hypothetical protein ASD11_11770 [Aeromicrobium sp. Root495]|uniref:DUF72 domain-containing protein n=1 Tax=Aeromicrobium sp. Root495 TaxID=1736550 RepID=UPI0006F712C8|nr:DUF72 domain-containing protein [Aeromicrobium sp. Root495]KQY60152.1 hypothetical protein ASD11_11770 [Aeromicrobium sp. Root495]
MTGTVRIGISGWTYPPWRGVFYPKGLRQKDELEHAAERMTSIEVNGSFYSLQRPESYRSWAERTPEGFVLALKGGRFITHMKKLADVETPLANFFASGPLALGDRMGPVLWQLPPTLGLDEERLSAFFDLLPRTTQEAAALATRHDERLEGRSWVQAVADRPIRHAIEVRHDSFLAPGFLDLLRRHDVAVVVADTAGRWPLIREVTSDFVYVRLHGDTELYASGYSEEALDSWAVTIRAWAEGGADVYTYFDNDTKVRAPFDAMGLIERLADLGPALPGRSTGHTSVS